MIKAIKPEPTPLADIVERNSGYLSDLPPELAPYWAVVRGALHLLAFLDLPEGSPEVQAKLRAIGPAGSLTRQTAEEYIKKALVEIREAKAAKTNPA